jgi:hypothetical protein
MVRSPSKVEQKRTRIRFVVDRAGSEPAGFHVLWRKVESEGALAKCLGRRYLPLVRGKFHRARHKL